MDLDEARRAAQAFLVTHPRVDHPVVVDVEEHDAAFVAHWTTSAFLRTHDVADSQGPGTGPLVVPKDGSEPRYLGSQRLDVELHRAGLGPPPVGDAEEGWGF